MLQIQNQNPKAQFSLREFNQKVNLKHTFKLKESNQYYYIPLFQKDEKIKFRNKFYRIIKLHRRTENFLVYRIQDLDNHQLFTIEYQFIFDDKLKYENYLYYDDQTRIFHSESQDYRKSCRIALMKDWKQDNQLKLTRFIHLSNLNQNAIIKLLHAFANNNQLEQLNYNQIYIDDKLQMKIQKTKQIQNSCFIQAPIAISPIINFQQTFLIGFYYAIINNVVIFNHYINREDQIKQSLQRGLINQLFQLQQQIKGTINYQYKLQIPKLFLQQGIKRIFDGQQLIEYNFFFQLIEIISISLRIQQLRQTSQNITTEIQEDNNQKQNNISDHQSYYYESSTHNVSSYVIYNTGSIENHLPPEGVHIKKKLMEQALLLYDIQHLRYKISIFDTFKNEIQVSNQQNTISNQRNAKITEEVTKGLNEPLQQTKHEAAFQKELEQKINKLSEEYKFSRTKIKIEKNLIKVCLQHQSFRNLIPERNINEDYDIEILYEYKQLFNSVESLMNIQLKTNIQIDLFSLEQLKIEIKLVNYDKNDSNSKKKDEDKYQNKAKNQNKRLKNDTNISSLSIFVQNCIEIIGIPT